MIPVRKESRPSVSVFMSVHNEAVWVGKAVESMLDQTYADFELLITDDGSVDDTGRILYSFEKADPRIHVIKHSSSQGLSTSLNEQIGLARGIYYARMDGDDISRADRLAKQVDFLEKHPQVGILGSYCQEIDTEGKPVCIWNRPITNNELQKALLRYNPFIHSTIMLRREVFERTGLYDPGYRYAQDYELWLRVAQRYQLANLPEPLVDLRVDWQKLASKNREARRCELRILSRHIRKKAYPSWYYVFLGRPLFWSLLPTKWIIKLKVIQRRIRHTQYSKSF